VENVKGKFKEENWRNYSNKNLNTTITTTVTAATNTGKGKVVSVLN
jgi:hypothetical protein